MRSSSKLLKIYFQEMTWKGEPHLCGFLRITWIFEMSAIMPELIRCMYGEMFSGRLSMGDEMKFKLVPP